MSHLIALSIGPVQSFIAAARRTRDLWGGSVLLSELSKSVARAIASAAPNSLIFPAPDNPSLDLAPDSPFLVANIVLAQIPGDAETARALVEKAAETAETRWQEFVTEAYSQVSPYVDAARWEQQKHHVLEVYAAWEPVTISSYRSARATVMSRLAARKSCRDFLSWPGVAGVPKSSLDGARESVWDPDRVKQMPPHIAARLRLGRQEQLDVIGLTKRLGLGNRQFPSVARLAAEDWVHRLDDQTLTQLAAAATKLTPHGLAQFSPSRFPQFAPFPFEGAMLFPSRLREFQDPPDPEVVRTLTAIHHTSGTPSPYLAVLMADGDRMGATLAAMSSPDEHRRFSQALAAFAATAGQIVQQHRGALIYAGGDDVLAMLPLSTSLTCAHALKQSFSGSLSAWAGLTLSVGITIGHALEDLEDLLERARRAEQHAKSPDRNGLSIHYAPRNQEGRTVRLRWNETETGVDDAHQEMLRLQNYFYVGALPDKAAFELSLLSRHYHYWPVNHVQLVAALRADALRILYRKAGVPPKVLSWLRDWINRRVGSASDLCHIADQLVIAQHLAQQIGTEVAIA